MSALLGLRRQVRRWIAPGEAAVLCYHRVFDPPRNRWGVAVTPAHFEEHLDYLCRNHTILPLLELLDRMEEGRVPDRAVVLTFDDGYADNLHTALPLLQRYDAPATVFVASGYVDQAAEFWWHELEQLVYRPPSVPSRITVSLGTRQLSWETRDWPRIGADGQRVKATPEGRLARNRAFTALRNGIRGLPVERRSEAIAQLRAQVGDPGPPRSDYGAMSSEELRRLAESGLVEIGAHTVHHPYLPGLTADEQREEIAQSKAALEALLERPVQSFSYPNGGFTAHTAQIVQELGFRGSGSTQADLVWRRSHPFALPRISIKDCTGDELAARLRHWFGG